MAQMSTLAPSLIQTYKRMTVKFRGSWIDTSDTCWVCGTYGNLELHHVIPRSYGGENGPQVQVCGTCHTGVHALSLITSLFDGSIFTESETILAVTTATKDWLKPTKFVARMLRAWCLGYIIYQARLQLKGVEEPNKKVKFSTTFSGEVSRKLKVIAKAEGNLSQEEMIVRLIHDKYDRDIGKI